MKMSKRLTAALCAAAALVLLLAGCGGSGGSQNGGQNGGPAAVKDSVTKRKLSDQTTFDPYKTSDQNMWEDLYGIYDTLFREDELGVFTPNLVTDYSFNEDGTELTMSLVQGVKFHNGETMTADDVVFSLNTAIASPFTSKFTNVMDHAEKVDDTTVKLVLKFAYGPILGCLVNATTSIVPQAAYEADPDSFATSPIGSGPYTLGEVVKGEKYVYTAFPDYFRGEAPIKTVVARVIPDGNAALMALQSGELDVIQPNQDYSDRAAIENDPNLEYYVAPQACTFLIGFNNEKGIFADKRMREAVALAVDKEDIALGATNGYAQPTDVGITPICPQVPTDFTGLERDVERAKQLVAEAGYPDGVDVTMRVISASNYTKPAEVVQDQLKEIGINITIEPMERAAWWDACYLGGDYTITIYANPVQVIDADFGAYPFLHSSEANGGNNFYNYKSAEMDKLLEDARISQNEAERKELYTKVCEIIRDESIFVPMYTGERTYAGVKGLQGVKADPMVRYYTYRYSWS
jgi:peptide/nickel transport system substrate-binding protein